MRTTGLTKRCARSMLRLSSASSRRPRTESQLLNSGVVWSPTTGPGQTYVKRHPVPFGEYVPFRGVLSRYISRLDRIPRDFAAGTKPGVLDLGPVVAGDVICFEVAFDDIVRDVVTGGATVITVQTNNATYGRTGPSRAAACAVTTASSRARTFRSWLQRLQVSVRSSRQTAQIQERTQEFTRNVLVDNVVSRDSLTIATRVGAWPELVLSLLAVGALVLATRRSYGGPLLRD